MQRRWMPWLLAGLCGLLACTARAGVDTPLVVRYPAPLGALDARPRYPIEALRLALERSGRPFVLRRLPMQISQRRAMDLLRRGDELDVAWTITTPEREASLRPVRVALDGGLFGWRVLLVKRGQSPRFAQVRGVADLAPLLGAQGHDWPDLPVLRANGLRVAGVPSYEGLFGMLRVQHVDYVPRSVLEVADEASTHPALEVEPRLLLRYPAALYFFVAPGDAELANALETGLRRARADGSLRAAFERHYGAALRGLALERRRVITLRHPAGPSLRGDAAAWLPPELRR